MIDTPHAAVLSACCGSSQRVLYASIRFDGDGWSKVDLECCGCGARFTSLCTARDALHLLGVDDV